MSDDPFPWLLPDGSRHSKPIAHGLVDGEVTPERPIPGVIYSPRPSSEWPYWAQRREGTP